MPPHSPTQPSTTLRILVGTTGGTAWAVAQAIAWACEDLVPSIELQRLDGLGTATLTPPGTYLLCCATHGSGEVPANAVGFLNSLHTQPAYLGHVRFGVVALGDSSYGNTFARGALQIDELLRDLGAVRVGEPLVLDACDSTPPEETAVTWCRAWLAQAWPGA